MKIGRKFILAGVAAVAVAGTAGLALAKAPITHTLSIKLPDGGTAQIQYTGNNPPKVRIGTEPFAVGLPAPDYWSFATPNRISAELDQELDDLLHQTSRIPSLQVNPDQGIWVDLSPMPPGSRQYSMISTVSVNGSHCTRTTQILAANNGARPKVISTTSGDCQLEGGSASAPTAFAPSIQNGLGTMEVNLTSGQRQATFPVRSAVFRSKR